MTTDPMTTGPRPHPTRAGRPLRAAVATLMLLVAAACAKDSILNPLFGEGCERSRARSGQRITGALNEDSCVDPYSFWTSRSAAYAAHPISLEPGKAYFVRTSAAPDPERNGRDGLYPVLSLWGRGEGASSLPLAVSESNGGDRIAEFFFVADRRGEHQLVVSSYDPANEYEYLGGYELEVEACPVLGLAADTGTTTFTLRASPCRRGNEYLAEFGGDTAEYNFITIRAEPFERISIRTSATDFTPAWEAFGPDLDTYAYLRGDAIMRRYVGEESRSMQFGPRGGQLTLAIGAVNITGPSREFTLHVSRSPGAVP